MSSTLNTVALFSIGALVLAMASACGREAREASSPTSGASATALTETTSARTSDENKALVRKYFDEVWGQRNPDAVNKYVASDLRNHAAIPSAQGADGLATIARKVQKAFPDLKMDVEMLIADADMVVARVVFDGTHKERLDFKEPLEPTNKHLRTTQVHTFRLKDGKVVESWMTMDKFDMLTQLGQMPPPKAP